MHLRWQLLLTWVLVSGCTGATKVIRHDTGDGTPYAHTPRVQGGEAITLAPGEFQTALASLARDIRAPDHARHASLRLFELDARSGTYLFEVASRRLTPIDDSTPLVIEPSLAEAKLTQDYLRWCARTGRSGDCLALFSGHAHISGDARFTLAFALAKGEVVNEMRAAFSDMADPEAMLAAALWTASSYAPLWTVPEPMTKGVAAVLTTALIIYVGVDTLWTLIQGFKGLLREADRAESFEALQNAGERFGAVIGRNAARAFLLLATAAIGSTGALLGSRLPALPGASRAALRAGPQTGLSYAAAAQVTTVSAVSDGFVLGLAPGAVTMTAHTPFGNGAHAAGSRAWKSMSGFKNAMGPAGTGRQWHHIVEQTPANIARFGPEALHNAKNVIAVDTQLHRQISAFFSSKQDVAGGKVVREWLRTQSYEKQREFGLWVLKQFGAL